MTRPNPDVRNQRGASSPAPSSPAQSSPAQQHPSRPSPFQVTLTHDLLESYVYVDVTEAISTTSALRRDVTWLKRFRERYLNPLYRALVRASAVSVACAPIALTIPVTQMLLEMDYEDFCREVVVVVRIDCARPPCTDPPHPCDSLTLTLTLTPTLTLTLTHSLRASLVRSFAR